MNKEILISNTKLKIVSYPVPAGKKFRLPNKSGMKYQFVITVDKNLEVHYHNTEKVYEKTSDNKQNYTYSFYYVCLTHT